MNYNAGLKKGRDQNKRDTAIKMLEKGKYTHEEIAECTGLSESDIVELAKQI